MGKKDITKDSITELSNNIERKNNELLINVARALIGITNKSKKKK